jgi:hypothetical protein
MLKQQRALLFWFVMVEIDIADSFWDEAFTLLVDERMPQVVQQFPILKVIQQQ